MHLLPRPRPRGRSFARLRSALAVGCALWWTGCASLSEVQQDLALQMVEGDYAEAIEVVDSEETGAFEDENRLIFLLERGMLLHFDGQYAASNAAFEEAKRLGDALYTRSLTREGISLLTNDYALAYAGENFERTLVHLFGALNYLALGEPESALVEIRQVGDYLRKLQVDSTNDNVYQEDALARYLSSLIYESAGELDAAFVDYRNALRAYADYGRHYSVGVPTSLLANAERVAQQLGPWAQQELRELGVGANARLLPPGAGEVFVLHYNGLVPIKGEDRFTIPFSQAWVFVGALQAVADPQDRVDIGRATAVASQLRGTDIISFAFPRYVDRSYSIKRMQPSSAEAITVGPVELVEDIGAIARRDLADRIHRIRARTIARAAIRYAIQKGMEQAARQASNKDTGDLLVVLTQVAGNIARYAIEVPDKRGWSTLPDEIWMATLVLPEGTHDLKIDFQNASGNIVESQTIPGVLVTAGGRRFVVVRTVR